MNRRTAMLSIAGIVSLSGCVNVTETDGNGGSDAEFFDASGDIDIVIDGEAFDLSADRFQAEHADDHSLSFHLHEFDDQWYMEGQERVTFAEGIGLLPHFEYENEDDNHVLTIDGTAYDEREGAEIEFLVDGEAVGATTYELRDDDSLRIEITTA